MFENLPISSRPQLQLPLETRATCSSCVMARADWPRDARDPGPFAGDLKCCTYEPFLPNFSIGRLLQEGKSDFAERLRRASERGDLTPLGLLPLNSQSDNFGRDSARKCSFLNANASCTIWSERPSVCRSYFCVSDKGEEGQAKWREAERLGNETEWTLAHELAWNLGLTQDEISSRTFAEWKGREHDFFTECARRAFDDANVRT